MTPISRRSFLYGAGAVIAATSLPVRGLEPPIRALSAREFHDSVGIATHPAWRSTIWGSSDWAARLVESGVKNARGEIAHGASGQGAMGDLRTLFAAGVKMCALIPGRSLDRADALADIQYLADYIGAENLCAIECVNEFNNPKRRPPDWAARLRDFQSWLYDTVKSNPHLDGVLVVAPSMWENIEADALALGNLEPKVDRGCVHYYTGGRRPSRAALSGGDDTSMAAALQTASITAPHRALYATEFGYNVAATDNPLSPWIVSERAAAKYILRGLLELFAAGVEKTFIYSLLDDQHRTARYGLLDEALNPRMSFQALRNMLALFADKRSDTPLAHPIDYALSGVGAALRHQLFQKSGNRFLLTMYLDADSYDRQTQRDIAVPPSPVTLSLREPASSIRLFKPLAGAEPLQSFADRLSVTIPVSDDVTVAEIVGGDSA